MARSLSCAVTYTVLSMPTVGELTEERIASEVLKSHFKVPFWCKAYRAFPSADVPTYAVPSLPKETEVGLP